MERILPAEIFVIHLQAGFTALHWIFLFIKLFLQSFFSVYLLPFGNVYSLLFYIKTQMRRKSCTHILYFCYFLQEFLYKVPNIVFLNKISIVFHMIRRYYSWLYYIKVPLCALLLFSYGILKGWSKKQHRQKAFPYIVHAYTRALNFFKKQVSNCRLAEYQ